MAKATGRAKYAYDVHFPGQQQAMILRSPIAKGVLKGLNLDEAKAMPGISAVVALKDTGNKIRFVGDALAAVSGETLDLVRDAIEKIRADYEEDVHNVDYLMDEQAPLLNAKGNVDEEWDDADRPLAPLHENSHEAAFALAHWEAYWERSESPAEKKGCSVSPEHVPCFFHSCFANSPTVACRAT